MKQHRNARITKLSPTIKTDWDSINAQGNLVGRRTQVYRTNTTNRTWKRR
jgi:hypothetical protein